MLYAIHDEVEEIETIFYNIRLRVNGISKNFFTNENQIVKLKTPLFKLGDKIFLIEKNIITKNEGEIVYFPRPEYSQYYEKNNDLHERGEFSEDGQMYAIHCIKEEIDSISYNVRFYDKRTKYTKDENIRTLMTFIFHEDRLAKHPAYDVVGRSTHDFLSRNKTNRMKTLDDKAYLPDDINNYITSFLPPPGKESLASHVNNRITHTRKSAIREFRKKQKPEDITPSEWWYDKWFNFDSEEDDTNGNSEHKNDSTNNTNDKNPTPKFRPPTASPWWYNLFNIKKKGGTRKRKLDKMRKVYKREKQ